MLLQAGIKQAVGRQYKVRTPRDMEVLPVINTMRFQFPELSKKYPWVYDNSVANEINLSGMENTRRDSVQYMFYAFEFESVTGIWTALETGCYIIIACENINDLPFSLIAPLKP
jgi:hypothetical protein